MSRKVKIQVPHLHGISMKAYHPDKRRLQMLLVLLLLVAATWIGYSLGSAGIRIPFKDKSESVAQLRNELDSSSQKISELEKEITRLVKSTDVEMQAAEQNKHALREKEIQLSKLNEELVFYRSLLAPENAGSGVEVRDFNLRASGSSEYYYDFLLTQSSRNNRVAKGKVNVTIDGKQGEIMRRIEITNKNVSSDKSLNYSFKYFQRLNGIFALPENFKPQQVLIEVAPSTQSKPAMQLSYTWQELISGG
ncbi:MAG: DUF6776 family protein [Pseudomonadota bacterium]